MMIWCLSLKLHLLYLQLVPSWNSNFNILLQKHLGQLRLCRERGASGFKFIPASSLCGEQEDVKWTALRWSGHQRAADPASNPVSFLGLTAAGLFYSIPRDQVAPRCWVTWRGWALPISQPALQCWSCFLTFCSLTTILPVEGSKMSVCIWQ